MASTLDLPCGDCLVRLRRYNLDPGLPLDRYNEVFPEYVNAILESPHGKTELGEAPWRRLRDRLIRWLGEEPVTTGGPDNAWTTLTSFEPLQYTLHGSAIRPPWRFVVYDGRDALAIVATCEVSNTERADWILALSHEEPGGPTRE